MKNPEQEFKKAYNSNPPVVVFDETNDKSSQVVLTDNRDIDAEISKRFPVTNMSSLKEAEDVCSNIYIKFHPYLKSLPGDPQEQMKLRTLLGEFKRINDYLEETGTQFLSGNEMTFVDCDIMPKLQHIRIAGKYYKNLDIPNELQALWSYMERCYQTKAFQESCPFDQDILMHYEGKVGTSHKPFGKTPTLQQPTMTLTRPGYENSE
jgi:glutathione S-transferase